MNTALSNYKLVKDAYRTLNKRKFEEAILILEQLLSSGMGDIYILLLLSVAYLYTNQFGKLARFINKMRDMDTGYLPLIQLEAFLRLKSAIQYDEGMRMYIDLVAKYPADTHINRGRNLLSNCTDFQSFQKDALITDFVHIPPPPRSLKKKGPRPVYTGTLNRGKIKIKRKISIPKFDIPLKPIIKVVFVAGLLALVVYSVWYFIDSGFLKQAVRKVKKPRVDLTRVDMISIGGTDYDLVRNIKPDTVPVYYQSVRDMTDDFTLARKLIKSEEYNKALVLLNSVYNSNVNFVVKEKVDFLIKFVMNLEDREFEDIPYRTVESKKYLYRGYAVRWRGRVVKVKEKDESQIFTIRINGKDDADGGVVDVFSRKVVSGIDNGSSVFLEGVIADFLGKDQRVYIVSKNIRKINK